MITRIVYVDHPRPIRRTYHRWRELGYQVQYGEHARGYNSFGEPLFTRRQVAPRSRRPRYYVPVY